MIPKLTFIYDRKGQATKSKQGVVELIISNGRVRKYMATGIKLSPREWSNGSVVGRPDWKELNDQLQTLKKKCSEIIIQMMENNGLDIDAVPALLKERVMCQQTFMDYAREIAERRYRKISAGTKEHYLHWFRFMEKWGKIIHFSDVTERNILKLDDELVKMGLKEVSRWSYHKIMKLFIIKAVEDGLINKNPYSRLDIKKGSEDGLKRYLTPSEFHRFESCLIPTERLCRVRDLFVFQTYTMMSYSDLCTFEWDKCENMGGQIVYKAKRQKTNQDFTIVLLEPAMSILQKYNYKLPIISNVKYNEYLKAAVMYAKIDKPVSTHWARHTGATMLLNEGQVPMHIIQHILGHASIRETEKTYAKVMDETIVETMVNYKKKFL